MHMFGLFKKTNQVAQKEAQYKALLEEAFKLSRIDRMAADKKTAEAEALWQEIEQLKAKSNNS